MCPNCRKMPSSTKANSTAKPRPPNATTTFMPRKQAHDECQTCRPASRLHGPATKPPKHAPQDLQRRPRLELPGGGAAGRRWEAASSWPVLAVGRQRRTASVVQGSMVGVHDHTAGAGGFLQQHHQPSSSSSADGFPGDGYFSAAQAVAKTAAGSLMSSPSALRRRRSKHAASSSLTRVEQGPAAEPMSPSKAAAPVRTFSSWLVMRFSSFSSTALVRVTLASAAVRRDSSTALAPVWSLSFCSARRLSRTGSNFIVDTAAEPTSVGVASPRLSFASCRAKRLWRTGSSLDGESFGALGEYRQGEGIILCRASSLDGVEHASSSFVRCFAQRAASTGSTGDSEAAPPSRGTAASSRASRPSSFARCRANQLASLGSMALPPRPCTHALPRERWMRRVPAH
mmetsp:Transcript_36446/g.116902  ORF Transcript_36446/g.116902 Transcript_36446/m.116902 type:complete len:400 (-) Transcript_36446:16-1215(-)